jgi:hypothetical protein
MQIADLEVHDATTTSVAKALRAETDLVERDADLYGLANQIAAGWTTQLHYVIGVPAVVFGAAAAATALAEAPPFVVGAVALLATALAGVQTFIGTEKRAGQQRDSAAGYFELRDQVRRFRGLDLELLPAEEQRTMVEELATRLSDLNRASMTITAKDMAKVRQRAQALSTEMAELLTRDPGLEAADIATQLAAPVERVDYMLRSPAVRALREKGADQGA